MGTVLARACDFVGRFKHTAHRVTSLAAPQDPFTPPPHTSSNDAVSCAILPAVMVSVLVEMGALGYYRRAIQGRAARGARKNIKESKSLNCLACRSTPNISLIERRFFSSVKGT